MNITNIGETFLNALFLPNQSVIQHYLTNTKLLHLLKNLPSLYAKESILKFESEDFIGGQNISDKLSSIKVVNFNK